MEGAAKEPGVDIYAYVDYRQFLRDLFRYEKEHSGMTLRSFAHQAGLASHAFLKRIIEGERSLSIETAPRVAQGFGLDSDRAAYFVAMVRLKHASSLRERTVIYRGMAEFRPKAKPTPIERQHYELFEKWYVFAIRELVAAPDFKEDARWIATRLTSEIKPEQAREAIAALLQAGYLVRGADGKLSQAAPAIGTGAEVSSAAVSSYHREMLRLAELSMAGTEERWRDLSSLALLVDRDQFIYIKSRIAQFRSEIINYLADAGKHLETEVDTEKELYYLNLQFFNGTDVRWKAAPGKDVTL